MNEIKQRMEVAKFLEDEGLPSKELEPLFETVEEKEERLAEEESSLEELIGDNNE